MSAYTYPHADGRRWWIAGLSEAQADRVRDSRGDPAWGIPARDARLQSVGVSCDSRMGTWSCLAWDDDGRDAVCELVGIA